MKKLLMIILSFTMLQTAVSATEIEVNISEGKYWNHKVEIIPILFYKMATPQIAVWVEDMNGNFIETVYVTGRVSDFLKKDKRAEVLPVWRTKILKKEGTKLDGIGGATQTKGVMYSSQLKSDLPETFRVFAEVNNSFDYNGNYTKKGKDNTINSGVNGQPSLVYMAEINEKTKDRIKLALYGCGSINGDDGKISKELSKITTAKEITKGIYIKIK